MGSSSLSADVKAFERLHIVRRRNSSYFGSKYRVPGAGKMPGSFQFAFNEGFVDDQLRRDIGQFTSLPLFHLLSHGLEVPCVRNILKRR